MSALKKVLIKILTVSVAAAAFVGANAQVRVVKSAGENPTLTYRGVTGNSQLSDAVESNLRNCGWFNLVSGGASDYTIAGAAAGSTVTMQIAGKERATVSDRLESEKSVKAAANRIVDKI